MKFVFFFLAYKMAHILSMSPPRVCTYYIFVYPFIQCRNQISEQAFMERGSATAGALRFSVTYLQRQSLQAGILSMTISSFPLQFGQQEWHRILPSGNPLSPARRLLLSGSRPSLGVRHSRERDRFTVRPATHSLTVHRPPFPLHSGCRGSGWQACGHRDSEPRSQSFRQRMLHT